MVSNAVARVGLNTLRTLAGNDSRLERSLRRRHREQRARRVTRTRGDGWVQLTGERFVRVVATDRPGPDRGIFVKGGCDLPALFLLAPLVREQLSGSLTIASQGSGISDARADVLLQTLAGVPHELAREICQRLQLPTSYFEPVLFEPSFAVPALEGDPVPKTVVALTVGPNLVRTVYRHRETGVLVDPGGWWLNQSMGEVLGDLSAVEWFRKEFVSIGRISVDQFVADFGRVVDEVKARTGGHVLVFNTLVVDPGDETHNYRLKTNPPTIRRRRFALALAELAENKGLHVVDVDRLLKRSGVDAQVDFAHYSFPEQQQIAAEAADVLSRLGVVEARR